MAISGDGEPARDSRTELRLPPRFDRVLAQRDRVYNHNEFVWTNSLGPEGQENPDLVDAATRLPDGAWPSAADSLYRRLAQSFGGYTPHVFGDHAAKAFPYLEQICQPLVAKTGYDARRMVDCKAPSTAAIAFGRNRRRVSLKRFEDVTCPLCGDRTHLNAITPWMVSYIGPPRWCARCSNSYFGSWPHSRTSAIKALQHYADVAGFVPSLWEATKSVPTDIADVQRDNVMAARMALPYKGRLKEIGLNPWANYVDAAGLAEESIVRSRGTQRRAVDGHWCRSLFECEIDNFMTRNGIAHEPEPLWPAHPRYNASGRRRADWRLSDGTMIEAAGMMASPDYAAKIRDKKRLATASAIPLVVILPQDLSQLNLVFLNWL